MMLLLVAVVCATSIGGSALSKFKRPMKDSLFHDCWNRSLPSWLLLISVAIGVCRCCWSCFCPCCCSGEV
ncbi:hypothetical protein BKA57DRAFT_455895 [Linnemannia elongata]|nr:hypothetical protein BKA57DRAFT_455895 [Linnemannia elongata]